MDSMVEKGTKKTMETGDRFLTIGELSKMDRAERLRSISSFHFFSGDWVNVC